MRLAKSGYYLRALLTLRALAGARSVAARLVRPSGALVLRDGLQLRVDSRTDLLVLTETLANDVYGLRELRPGVRTIVDVGAGGGDFAVAAARAFPAARVIAFEPDARAFSRLRATIEANRCTNVELHRAAVGTAVAYELVRDGPYAAAVPASAGAPHAEPGVALGDVLGGTSVDLLKVDCEGAELDVLASLGPAGLARVRAIVLECHGTERAQAVVALLVANGFDVVVAPDRYSPELGYVRAVASSSAD